MNDTKPQPVKLDVALLGNGITKVSLSGRLDIEGAINISGEFNKLLNEKKNVLVDLAEVTFIASAGVHMLVTAATATIRNGGKMVLLNPQPNVEQVLRTTRVDTMMPIIHDSTAIATVFGA
jgi:anti-anti-sigma factor